MSLPAPNLDDRRFQDLVDDAKRLVQQRCPEWTDHNVSDPGVTLIETFAYMVDQLLYRLNRVGDRSYVKFLELINLRLFPPAAARADVTFWLSAPQPAVLRISAGTEVATVRTETEEAVTFTLTEDLPIVPSSVQHLASVVAPPVLRDHSDTLHTQDSFFCFDRVPKPGDALLVGLSEAVPSNVVLLRFDCEIEGVGVDPLRPPLRWEAWTAGGWAACELDRDETGGLNRPGDVVLHVPRGHTVSLENRTRAGWLRCRVVPADDGRPAYSASPKINRLQASTIGGTAAAVHAEIIRDEILGLSEGVPGQRFHLKRQPVVAALEPAVLEVAGGSGWQEWDRVETFAHSGAGDRHFVLDPVAGEVLLGPAVRQPDGSLRQYAAVPAKGAPLRLRAYGTGGGRRGNVASHAISILKSSLPYVARVDNRAPASGGVDGEDIENAKLRGPILMRTRSRAVTAEDYEQLALEAAPEVARVRCAPADPHGTPGAVRILVVPAASDSPAGELAFEQLIPSDETLQKIARHLEERRVIGARVVVEPPEYRGLTVVARLRARSRTNPEALQAAALRALYGYFHPLRGGPEGRGWPFERPVHMGEVYAVLQQLPGTEFVEEVRLFAADPLSGERGSPVQRIDVGAHALVFSYEHQVRAERP